MLEKVLNANYSASDCAFALQHGNFAVFRRDLTRSGNLFFPRKTSAGPGGGEYRYAHIFEMAIHLAVGSSRKGLAGKLVGGLAFLLSGNGYATQKVNALGASEKNEFLTGASRFELDDYPKSAATGQVSVPMEYFRMVDFPSYFFEEDFISRDLKKPTFAIYNPVPHKEQIGTDVELIADMPLSEVQDRVIRLRSQHGDDDFRRYIEEECDDIPVINLTTMLSRIDRRLALRLEASTIKPRD